MGEASAESGRVWVHHVQGVSALESGLEGKVVVCKPLEKGTLGNQKERIHWLGGLLYPSKQRKTLRLCAGQVTRQKCL